MRTSAEAWDKASEYGPYCELFFFFLQMNEPAKGEEFTGAPFWFVRLHEDFCANVLEGREGRGKGCSRAEPKGRRLGNHQQPEYLACE